MQYIGDEVISWVKKSYHTRHYSMWNFAMRLCLLIKKSAFSLLTLSCGGTSISTGCLQIKPRVYYARVVQKCNVHFGYISLKNTSICYVKKCFIPLLEYVCICHTYYLVSTSWDSGLTILIFSFCKHPVCRRRVG